MDPTLLLTIGIIFVAAFVGAVLRGLAKDHCLRDLHKFHVTVKRKQDEHPVWGVLHLEATGFELEYKEDNLDPNCTHIETSFLFYKDEYPQIQAIHRYVDTLSRENKKRRDQDVKRTFHPDPLHYLGRALRNFIHTAADSLNEVINLLLGRSKIVTGQLVLAPGQTHLRGMTKNILGYVGTSYDPLLEHLIGVRVVVEVLEDDVRREYVGVLKDYSATFLEVLDVFHPATVRFVLTAPQPSPETEPAHTSGQRPQESVCAVYDKGVLTVKNRGPYPVLVRSIQADDRELAFQALVPGYDSLVYAFDDPPRQIELSLEVIHHLDMIVPRTHALVRHRAERYNIDDAFRAPFLGRRQPGRSHSEEEAACQTDKHGDAAAIFARWLLLANCGGIAVAHTYLKRARRT